MSDMESELCFQFYHLLFTIKNCCMKKFVVERNFPGAANLSAEELQAIAKAFFEVAHKFEKPYIWIESFIADDKIFCIHIAESEEMVREHSKMAKFPVNTISEVKTIIDSSII